MGIKDIIAKQQAYIDDLKARVAQDKLDCTNAERTMNTNYVTRNNSLSAYIDGQNGVKSLQKRIDDLKYEMKLAINNARRQGKSTVGIEQYYKDLISGMEMELAELIKTNSPLSTKYNDAESNYRNSRYGDISATNKFLTDNGSLFGAILEQGKNQMLASLPQLDTDPIQGQNFKAMG